MVQPIDMRRRLPKGKRDGETHTLPVYSNFLPLVHCGLPIDGHNLVLAVVVSLLAGPPCWCRMGWSRESDRLVLFF